MTLHAGLSAGFDLSGVLVFCAAAREATVVPDVFVGACVGWVGHRAVEGGDRSTFSYVDRSDA